MKFRSNMCDVSKKKLENRTPTTPNYPLKTRRDPLVSYAYGNRLLRTRPSRRLRRQLVNEHVLE